MRNVLLTLAYDGTNFCGWQRQPNVRTVQGELEQALSQVCGEEIELNGTSRTDAGVHALGQCASFTGNFGIPTERIPLAANNLLEDIRVLDAKEMPEGFHARFDAKGKTYLYRIATAPLPPLFLRNNFYWLDSLPDTKPMGEAASLLVGTHNFAAFQAAGGTPRETTVRTLRDVKISPSHFSDMFGEYAGIDIEVNGDGFLYNMVRIIAGTLAEVGLGLRTAADVQTALASHERKDAGRTAPPQGLYLKQVHF